MRSKTKSFTQFSKLFILGSMCTRLSKIELTAMRKFFNFSYNEIVKFFEKVVFNLYSVSQRRNLKPYLKKYEIYWHF